MEKSFKGSTGGGVKFLKTIDIFKVGGWRSLGGKDFSKLLKNILIFIRSRVWSCQKKVSFNVEQYPLTSQHRSFFFFFFFFLHLLVGNNKKFSLKLLNKVSNYRQ